MKILFVIPEEYLGDRWGGVTSYTLSLARSLHTTGHKADILTPGKSDEKIVDKHVCIYKVLIRSPGNILTGITQRVFPRISYELRWMGSVLDFIRTHGPYDMIEAPEWRASTLLVSLCKKYPVVVRLHRSMYQYQRDNRLPMTPSDYVLSALEIVSIFLAKGVSSPTSFMIHSYNWLWRLKPLWNLQVIPNGIRLPALQKRIKNRNTRPYILSVGRIEIGKGFKELIQSFAVVAAANAKLTLIIVGEDTKMYVDGGWHSYTTYLKKYATSLRVENRVIFIPRQSRKSLSRYYQQCLLYVTSSYGHENQSMALLEAISWGKAVIGSTAGGTKESIVEGKNGLLYETGNSNDLTDKLFRMINAPSFRISCEMYNKTFRRKYDVQNTSKQTVGFYHRTVT
jgi:glycosyltransferase involved in cell wall biosynthesis